MDTPPEFRSTHTMNEASPTCASLNRHLSMHSDPENPEQIRKNAGNS